MGENEKTSSDNIVVADIADRVQQKLVRRWSVVFAFLIGGLTAFGIIEVRHLVSRAEHYAQNSLANEYREVVLNTVVEQTSSYVPNLDKISANIQTNDSSIKALTLRLDKLEEFLKDVANSSAQEAPSIVQSKARELTVKLQGVESAVNDKLREESPKGKGWIYIGEYDPGEEVWTSNYVEVEESKPPSQLVGKTKVKISVDGLNVRNEKYSGDIIQTLNRQSRISVDRVESYYSSNYYWAYVTFK